MKTLKEKIVEILLVESINARTQRKDEEIAEEILALVREEIEKCLK
jgi:hypothetical protein